MLVGDHVTADVGTGVVHTAPEHGQDEYVAWMAHHSVLDEHSDILCPVDADVCFTAEAGDGLEGLSVLDEGNVAVIDPLKNSDFDGRVSPPILVRLATTQWFARLDALHKRSQRVLEEVSPIA